jgi:hypothetical protein
VEREKPFASKNQKGGKMGKGLATEHAGETLPDNSL